MFGAMKIYTVHIKPGMVAAQQKPLFIKEGFNFWALMFTILWTLYNKLWLPSLFIFLFNMVLVGMMHSKMLSLPSAVVVDIGFHLIIGFLANDWLRAKLARRGYVMSDISAADTLLRAEQRYFERILATA
jgi:hypothetical protein